MHPNYLDIETCHIVEHKACQNLCQMSILNTFLKSQICSSTYILHQIFEISPSLSSVVQNLVTPKVWTLYPQKPKHSNLTNSLLVHYSCWQKNKKTQKIQILKFIFTMKLHTHTFGRHYLQVICFSHPVSVTQFLLSFICHHNLFKSPKNIMSKIQNGYHGDLRVSWQHQRTWVVHFETQSLRSLHCTPKARKFTQIKFLTLLYLKTQKQTQLCSKYSFQTVS